EEGWSTYGVTAELTAGVQERCFDYLDAPIRRLGGAQVPMPYSLGLEKASIPTSEDIKRLVRVSLGRKPDARPQDYERKSRWFPLIAASAKPTRPAAGQAPLLSFRRKVNDRHKYAEALRHD